MKLGCYKNKIVIFLFIVSFFSGFSQQSYVNTSTLTAYNNALQLYYNNAYPAAQKIFKQVHKESVGNSYVKADAAYYEAMCAVKLQQPEADTKVLRFVEEYPNSAKKNSAYFNVANYYFANKKVSYALKWYKKVNLELLSKEETKELQFKMGYCFLVVNEYNLAKERFSVLLNDAKYGNDSRYYYGYVAYKLEDYSLAETTLMEIADKKSYQSEISYYLLDISFKAGKFENCIAVGKKLLTTTKKKEYSEISKIVGESYFNLKKYAEAIPYLKDYKGKKGKWNNTDYYQLGFAYYKQNDFNNAINYFNKIIDEKNSVSQNAYYHLGKCYLQVEKKTEALNAFKSASEMNFDANIAQDATLNYAKLSYEEGNPFKSVAEVLQDYLKKYPKSSSYDEINQLVVSSYVHQQDYKGALVYLANKKSKENTAMTLEVSYYRGTQLFNENKLTEALSYFAESTKSNNLKVRNNALYWEAETNYRLENYATAVAKFLELKTYLKDINNPFSSIDYTIGYSFFNLKEYEKAVQSFLDFLRINTSENTKQEDALIRLADSYFALANYKKAIAYYAKVAETESFGIDYAQYQVAMSLGFLNDNQAKINALTKLVNTNKESALKDDALYQLAITYTILKENTSANQAYNRLLEKHPNSIFLPKAMVRQGLLYYNDGENQKALDKFKKIATMFPNSPEAFQAVANARNIYIDSGKLDDYIAWTNSLQFITITNSDIDNTTFAVAEKQYFESKNSNSIKTSLVKYLQDFSNGIHKLKANFYLAETYFKENEPQKALENYKVVLAQAQNEFSEESLNKVAQIYLQKQDFKSAQPILERLEKEAYALENILFAQSNLMKGYYETEAYKRAFLYAKKILEKDKVSKDLANDAKIIIARLSFKTEDFTTAQEFYAEVEKNAFGELKAEALYYKAFFTNNQNDFEASNKVVQNLIANYSAYKYWAVKSYVVMGKNYYGLQDVYQATFVLENVIKNFTQFKDIVTEAQQELDSIKINEAKTNNSIAPTKAKTTKNEKKK